MYIWLPKARRTLLVERCQASVLGWEEPPEELLLSLSQAACLWGYFADGRVYTASKEHQSRVGVTCQQILSLLCQTFNLPSSSVYRGNLSGQAAGCLPVDEALRQSGLQCMLALIRSSCSGLADLHKGVHTESVACTAESISGRSSVKVIAAFLESFLLTVVNHSSGAGTNATSAFSDFADECLWGLLSTCSACLPKPIILQVLSSVYAPRFQCGTGVEYAVRAEMLTRLLRLATSRRTESDDSRRAATVLLSWCLSFRGQGTGVSGDPTTETAVAVEGDSDAKEYIHDENENTDMDLIIHAAISKLHMRDRLHLCMAVESLLGSSLSKQMPFLSLEHIE